MAIKGRESEQNSKEVCESVKKIIKAWEGVRNASKIARKADEAMKVLESVDKYWRMPHKPIFEDKVVPIAIINADYKCCTLTAFLRTS